MSPQPFTGNQKHALSEFIRSIRQESGLSQARTPFP